MRKALVALMIGLAVPVAAVGGAHAQLYPPGGVGAQPVIPFPTAPPPIPPPPITVPVVLQMNSPPPFALQNTAPGIVTQDRPPKPVLKRSHQPSYGERVARCLEQGAAIGLGPNERAAYSRSCANY